MQGTSTFDEADADFAGQQRGSPVIDQGFEACPQLVDHLAFAEVSQIDRVGSFCLSDFQRALYGRQQFLQADWLFENRRRRCVVASTAVSIVAWPDSITTGAWSATRLLSTPSAASHRRRRASRCRAKPEKDCACDAIPAQYRRFRPGERQNPRPQSDFMQQFANANLVINDGISVGAIKCLFLFSQ